MPAAGVAEAARADTVGRVPATDGFSVGYDVTVCGVFGYHLLRLFDETLFEQKNDSSPLLMMMFLQLDTAER